MIFKENARPLVLIFFAAGLVAAGVSAAFGHPFPEWFIGLASTYVVGYSAARGVSKAKGKG